MTNRSHLVVDQSRCEPDLAHDVLSQIGNHAGRATSGSPPCTNTTPVMAKAAAISDVTVVGSAHDIPQRHRLEVPTTSLATLDQISGKWQEPPAHIVAILNGIAEVLYEPHDRGHGRSRPGGFVQ